MVGRRGRITSAPSGSATGVRSNGDSVGGREARAELTLVVGGRHTEEVRGAGDDDGLVEKDVVEALLRDLTAATAKWEALIAEAETITYSVDLGDIRAVANSDGRLVDLTLHAAVTSDYSHHELADRLNTAFRALREEAQADHQERYGGRLT